MDSACAQWRCRRYRASLFIADKLLFQWGSLCADNAQMAIPDVPLCLTGWILQDPLIALSFYFDPGSSIFAETGTLIQRLEPSHEKAAHPQ